MRPTAVLLVVLAACGDRNTAVSLQGSGPFALDDALAYLDGATSSLVIVDPAGAAGPEHDRQLLRIGAGEKPVRAVSVPRTDDPSRLQLLVVDPVGAQVLVVADKSGQAQALAIGVPLEALDVRGDGRFALAYQPDGATPSRSLFAFPNTVAVLDLDAAAPSATALRLGSAGARPLKAVFSDSLRFDDLVSVGGVPTHRFAEAPLALVFVKGGLVPVDLARAAAGPLVPLTPDQSREVRPAEVLFTNNGSDERRGTLDNLERAFVRSTGGELYVLAMGLTPSALADANGGMGVIVALENVVTPDATVADIELFFAPDGTELLLAAANHELILVNGYTGVATRLQVDTPVDTLVRFVDPASGDSMALGYSKASPAHTMLRLDPLALERRRANGVEVLRLGSPVTDVDVATPTSRAVLEYQDSRDLGVLDLTRHGEVLDLRFAAALTARGLAAAGDRLWLASRSPDDGEPYLAEVELGADLGTRQVRLDADGRAVGQAGRFLFVDHGDPAGRVTFFPVDDLQRQAAIAFSGVLYADLLEAPAPEPTTTTTAAAE